MDVTGLERRLDRLAAMAPGEPYTGTTSTFRCGHPKTDANTYWVQSRGRARYRRCRECVLARAAASYQPSVCGTCGEPIGNSGRTGGYHPGSCEPTTCTCPDGGRPDGLGECATCRRLVLSHSWHNGRPR